MGDLCHGPVVRKDGSVIQLCPNLACHIASSSYSSRPLTMKDEVIDSDFMFGQRICSCFFLHLIIVLIDLYFSYTRE